MRLPHRKAYTNRKAMARKMNYEWDLSLEQFSRLASQCCADCQVQPCKGVYRRDVYAPFNEGNCLPLCPECGRKRPKRPKSQRPKHQPRQAEISQPSANTLVLSGLSEADVVRVLQLFQQPPVINTEVVKEEEQPEMEIAEVLAEMSEEDVRLFAEDLELEFSYNEPCPVAATTASAEDLQELR